MRTARANVVATAKKKVTKAKASSPSAGEVKSLQSDFNVYKELKAVKADIDSQMKEKKASIEAFADKYKANFTDDRYELEGGYLRFGKKSEIKAGKKFSLVDFVKTLPEYLKATFNTAMVKKALETPEKAAEFKKHGVELVEKESLEIVEK